MVTTASTVFLPGTRVDLVTVLVVLAVVVCVVWLIRSVR